MTVRLPMIRWNFPGDGWDPLWARGYAEYKGHKIRLKIDDGDSFGSDWSLYCDDRQFSKGHSGFEMSAGAYSRLNDIINDPFRHLIDEIDAGRRQDCSRQGS